MSDFISIIESFDHKVLLFINSLNSPFLDEFMWIVSSVWFGLPFYVVFIVLLTKTYNLNGQINSYVYGVKSKLFENVYEGERITYDIKGDTLRVYEIPHNYK